jgi:hypothetical protein
MAEMTKKSFISACKLFMGLPHESLPTFKAGYDQLTAQDRADLVKAFADIGVEITDPVRAGGPREVVQS